MIMTGYIGNTKGYGTTWIGTRRIETSIAGRTAEQAKI